MRKKIIGGVFLVVFLSALSSIARADMKVDKPTRTRTEEIQREIKQEETVDQEQVANDDSRKTEAFDVVTSAYQGEYEEQGIPGFAQLFTAYTVGEVTAEKLVIAAIEKGDLAPNALEDEEYINAVDLQLESLRNR